MKSKRFHTHFEFVEALKFLRDAAPIFVDCELPINIALQCHMKYGLKPVITTYRIIVKIHSIPYLIWHFYNLPERFDVAWNQSN
jgi:hypothetical protein